MSDQKMRIVLDLQAIQSASRVRGIGRYSLSLAKALVKEASEHEIYLVLNHSFPESIDEIRYTFSKLVDPKNILVFESFLHSAEADPNNCWHVCASELIREQYLQSLKPDVVHLSSLFEGFLDDAVTSVGCFATELTTAVTLYDLIPLLNQEHYLTTPNIQKWYFRKLESLKRADLLFAISEATRQEAIEALNLDPKKIIQISADAHPQFKKINFSIDDINKIKKRYNINRDYIMYSGAIKFSDPRKNIPRLIEAYASMPQNIRMKHQLVLVGNFSDDTHNVLTKQCKRLSISNNDVIMTGYVKDQELVSLYNLCKLFILPSLHEGFGLPLLEAMRCGAPVIASNRTSMPEVVGMPDALFDPEKVESISQKMKQVLSNNDFLNRLREHASLQQKKFSWRASAQRVLNAYENITTQQNLKKPLRKKGSNLLNSNHTSNSFKNNVLDSLFTELSKIKGGKPTELDLAHAAMIISENKVFESEKKILVDVSVLSKIDSGSGIQRVTRNVLSNLLLNPPQDYSVAPVYRKNGQYWYAWRFLNRFMGVNDHAVPDSPLEINIYDIFLGLDLDLEVDETTIEYLRHHAQRGMAVYFVVYDLLPILRNECFMPHFSLFFRNWFTNLLKIADGLICISRSVADEVKKTMSRYMPQERIKPLKIGYFHLGADIESDIKKTREINEDDEHLLALFKDKIVFLMVGTIEPRKGHAQVLVAMEKLWEHGHEVVLAIAGKQGWNVDSVVEKIRTHPENGKKLIWFECASDELLLRIYDASTALLMASEGEGFGLPLIEAAQHNLPIITRDLPVFREVARENAYYFSATSGADLADCLMKWLTMYKQNSHPPSRDMKWLTWKESTDQLTDVILNNNWYIIEEILNP